MLDPDMSDIQIETEFVSAATHDDSANWCEKPLSQLRKIFTSPEEVKLLENEIVGKQNGRRHPQDVSGENREMRLYWYFQESTDRTRNRQQVGTRLSARGDLPNNKAAKTAVGDGLLAAAATFGGKGSSDHSPDGQKGGAGKGKGKPGPKAKPKAKKVRDGPMQSIQLLLSLAGLAAEKRKIEKNASGKAKAKCKPKAKATSAPAPPAAEWSEEWPEEWPEDEHGEDLDDDDDDPNGNDGDDMDTTEW
eukprot:s1252_g24.t1